MNRLFLAVFVLAGALAAQPLDPAKLLQPPTDSWPTYNGDYTGRRYSPLAKINQALTLDEAVSYLGPEERSITLASPDLVERLGALSAA